MRIIEIINRKMDWGGEDVAAEQIATALSKHHTLERCIFDSASWKGVHPLKQALWMWSNPHSLQRLEECHRRVRPDFWLIHGVIPVASLGVYSLAKKLKVPIINYLHNFRPFSVNSYLWANGRIEDAGLRKNFWPEILAGSWQGSRFKTFWLGMLYSFSHRFQLFDSVSQWIAISDFIEEKIVSAGVEKGRVNVLRHFYQTTDSPPVNADSGYYLFLGRLSEEKGIALLLETWNKLYLRHGSTGPVLCIAGKGPYEKRVCSTCERNPLVKYLGFLSADEKRDALANCRAVIAPSLWWEGLGLIAYEAYNASRPVLGSSSGGLKEVILDGITGFLHTPGDIEQLMEHIYRFEASPELARKMGASGHQWLVHNASEEIWLAKFDQIAEKAIHT